MSSSSTATSWPHIWHFCILLIHSLLRCSLNLPLCQSYHWPVNDFIILTMTYKAVHSLSPSYTSELISPTPNRQTPQDALFCSPLDYSLRYCYQNVCHAFPIIWNLLPQHIRLCPTTQTFKRNLKPPEKSTITLLPLHCHKKSFFPHLPSSSPLSYRLWALVGRAFSSCTSL